MLPYGLDCFSNPSPSPKDNASLSAIMMPCSGLPLTQPTSHTHSSYTPPYWNSPYFPFLVGCLVLVLSESPPDCSDPRGTRFYE